MRRLDGKVAIVTGAGVGIGAACALRLASEGAAVLAADINLSAAERVCAQIGAAGGVARAQRFDLHDAASIAEMVQFALTHFGRLDVLLNNAADTRPEVLGGDGAVGSMADAVWEQTFHGNARGTMIAIREALPALIAAGDSAIINMSSGAALLGDLYRPAYGASKAAINSLTRYVAAQYGKMGVRCNAVSPGLIVTPENRGTHGEEALALFRRHTLTRDLGTPEDIAATVALLASDEGRFITGQVIAIDGGIASHFPHVADIHDSFWAQMGG